MHVLMITGTIDTEDEGPLSEDLLAVLKVGGKNIPQEIAVHLFISISEHRTHIGRTINSGPHQYGSTMSVSPHT